MSSSRTKHVLHHGCVLATVLALSPLLAGCAQVNSVVDTQWLSDIAPNLTGERVSPEAQLDVVVRSILPAEYSPSYGDGVDRAQSVRRPSTDLEWEGQIRSLVEAHGLGVTFEDKMVRIDRIVSRVAVDAAVSAAATSAPSATDVPKAQLTNATIMGMPRDQKTPVNVPAPLMTPEEAAVLEQAQHTSDVVTSPNSAVLPPVLPAPKPQQDKRETSSEKKADIDSASLPKADLVEATMMGKPRGADTNPDAPSAPVVPHDTAVASHGNVQSYAARMAHEAEAAEPKDSQPKAELAESTLMGRPVGERVIVPSAESAPVVAPVIQIENAAAQPVIEAAVVASHGNVQSYAARMAHEAAAAEPKDSQPKAELAESTVVAPPAGESAIVPSAESAPVVAPAVLAAPQPVERPPVALVNATVMDVPRGETDHPTSLMSPQEAALLTKMQTGPAQSVVADTASPAPETALPETVLIDVPVVKVEVPTPVLSSAPVSSDASAPVILAHAGNDHPLAAAPELSSSSAIDAAAAMPTATALVSASSEPAPSPPKAPAVTLAPAPSVSVTASPSDSHFLVPPSTAVKDDVAASAHVSEPAAVPAPEKTSPENALSQPEMVPAASSPTPAAPEVVLPPAVVDAAPAAAQSTPAAMVPVSDEDRVIAAAPATAPDMTAAVGTPQGGDHSAPVASEDVWKAERGDTLRGVFQKWCDHAGVQLNWSTEFDYPLQASVSINDTFENAVRTMLGGFTGASPQPYGRLHRQANAGSMLLIIQTRGNRYED